jgi:hypothetical protein
MKVKLRMFRIAVLVYVILVCGFVLRARACDCYPPCGSCQSCDAGVCVNDCNENDCEECINGNCVTIDVNSVTVDANSVCVGCNVTFTVITDPCGYEDDVEWSAPGGDPNSGTGETFTTSWDTTGTHTATAFLCDSNDSNDVTVVEVASLEPNDPNVTYTEIDDDDEDPNTRSFAICIADPNHDPNVVTVIATPNPDVNEPNLPTCWTLTGGTGTSKLTRTVDRTTAGVTTITCECNTSSKTTKIYVVEVASLLPDEGTEIDDGDNDPNTKRYLLFKAASGNVTVTATPNPELSEDKLPDCWTLTGGTGTGKLTRTIDKTTASTTEITCTAGASSKKVTFHVIEVEVASVGFTSDHMITEWGGSNIDDPDGSTAVWTSGGTNDPVCYTKNTAPTMFAALTVTPNIAEPDISGISVRAKVGGTIIGSASGCKFVGTAIEDGTNTDGDVDGISGGSAIPGSDGVKTLTPTFTWEVSSDGTNWFSAESSGAHTMHFTDATPDASPLYDLGLEKACEYADGAADFAGEINTDFAAEISYVPSSGCTSHNLCIFSSGSGQCCCHAEVFCLLISHVTNASPSSTDSWGGCSASTHCHFKFGTWHGPSFRCDRPAEDSAPANPHFNFHVEVTYSGTTYDPSYGLTGSPTFTEFAPVVAGSHPTAATKQTGSYPPATKHTVSWTCPH